MNVDVSGRSFAFYNAPKSRNTSITLMLDLQQTRSNASHVLLTSVVANNSGKYGCEASADAPSFHTQIMFKEMMVVGEYREMQASNM